MAEKERKTKGCSDSATVPNIGGSLPRALVGITFMHRSLASFVTFSNLIAPKDRTSFLTNVSRFVNEVTCLGLLTGGRDLSIESHSHKSASTHVTRIKKRVVVMCAYRQYWLKVRLGVLRSYRSGKMSRDNGFVQEHDLHTWRLNANHPHRRDGLEEHSITPGN